MKRFPHIGMHWLRPLCLVCSLLLIVTHRLPAPIVEEEKPTPAPERTTKPKPKRTVAESETNRAKTSGRAAPATAPARPKKFAGSWSGTMATIPWGNLPSVVTIDSTETMMAMSWYDGDEPGNPRIYRHFKPSPENERGHVAAKPAYAVASLEGDTMTATFSAPLLGSSKWSITPNPDGITARVRMQAFMNNFTAVFQRTSR